MFRAGPAAANRGVRRVAPKPALCLTDQDYLTVLLWRNDLPLVDIMAALTAENSRHRVGLPNHLYLNESWELPESILNILICVFVLLKSYSYPLGGGNGNLQ